MPRQRSLAGWRAFDLVLVSLVVVMAFWLEPSAQLRAIIALLGALTLLWPRSPGVERRRTRLILLLAIVAIVLSAGRQSLRFATTWDVREWNVYHYYLGAKYFKELGYTDLYDATLEADRQGPNYWKVIRRVRNLETYEIESRDPGEQVYEPLRHFSPDRWESFKRDVEALSGQRSARSWRGIFVDRGYNATPVWTAVGSSLAHLAPADKPLALKILCSLDLVFLAATYWLMFRVYGLRRASLVVLLLAASPVNFNRFVGGFLQYDWFCAVAAALCFYRLRRPVTAAGLMAYAVLTRVFPLLFVLAALIPYVFRAIRSRRLPRLSSKFLGALVAWGALGLAISLLNGRGLSAWGEFADGISTHKEHHPYGERRVGLQFLLTHEIGSLDFDETTQERRQFYERQKSVYGAVALVLIVGTLVVLRRQRAESALLLGLVPTFALLVTSRYYWSYLALLPLVGGRRGPPADRSRWLAAVQSVLFMAYYAFDARYGDRYSAYVVFNVLLLGYLVFLLLLLEPTLQRCWRSLARMSRSPRRLH